MNEIVSEFRDSIDEELVRRKFSSLNDDEIPVWMGSPTVLSYSPRYLLAVIIFSVHFIFYRVAVTIFAEGKEGFFYTFLRIIDQLFDFIKIEIGGNQSTYNAWGHSAGAQFLHRFIFYLPDSKLNIAVCSNAGWYTVPESAVAFPYGLLESQLSNVNLISAFSKKLYVHLGDADTDPNSSSLRHNDIVDEQQGLNLSLIHI